MSNDILDVEEFKDRVQDDVELLLELLDIFVEDYTEKRKLLSECAASNNTDQVKAIAHSLKGASGNISAKKLREICLKMEEMGKSEDLTGLDALLSDMDACFTELSGRITEVKAELGS